MKFPLSNPWVEGKCVSRVFDFPFQRRVLVVSLLAWFSYGKCFPSAPHQFIPFFRGFSLFIVIWRFECAWFPTSDLCWLALAGSFRFRLFPAPSDSAMLRLSRSGTLLSFCEPFWYRCYRKGSFFKKSVFFFFALRSCDFFLIFNLHCEDRTIKYVKKLLFDIGSNFLTP